MRGNETCREDSFRRWCGAYHIWKGPIDGRRFERTLLVCVPGTAPTMGTATVRQEEGMDPEFPLAFEHYVPPGTERCDVLAESIAVWLGGPVSGLGLVIAREHVADDEIDEEPPDMAQPSRDRPLHADDT